MEADLSWSCFYRDIVGPVLKVVSAAKYSNLLSGSTGTQLKSQTVVKIHC